MTLLQPAPPDVEEVSPEAPPVRRERRVRRGAMRGRRVVVRLHRWLSLVLLAWVVVISTTGAWLVVHESVESWFAPDRYRATGGDVGPQAALDAARDQLPDGATVWSVTMPVNGRGVYQVAAEAPSGQPPAVEGAEAPHEHLRFFVDPGSGTVNDVVDEEGGVTWWLYRGHMYLWQDRGVFGAFDPETGWCRPDAAGVEPGGLRGVVCDVLPDGLDMVAYLAAGFVVVLLSGFYVWYWPGVRRWSSALVLRRRRGRFAFTMSLHKVVGFVVWVPLLVIAFTGMAFAFPNLNRWYETVTPARDEFDLWVPPEAAATSDAADTTPLDLDDVRRVIDERFPERTIEALMPPADETATYTAWVTRGYSPWTREGGAGNVLVSVDQYSGEILDDATPEQGNVFDQAWDDWSFPLHTGDFGGTVTRVAWVVVGLSPLALATTGVTMNLIRRRKRRRAHAAPPPLQETVAPSP